VEDYISIVQKLKPRFLLIENVRGFTLPFKKHGDGENRNIPYSARIQVRLEQAGYTVYSQMVDLSDFGVPQTRKRFILIAIRTDDPACKKLNGETPFDLLEKYREAFLSHKRLPCDRPVSAREAIGDLEINGKELIDSDDSPIKGFKQIVNADGNYTSSFITLMRTGVDTAPNSLRLPRHGARTIKQFREIITTCTKGKTLGSTDRKRLGLKKRAITPLDANMPSATITTLPDDIIHYSEPRILTVRENARMQTFPDWFQFTGTYTTGTKRRQNDCPRYTQVGNAFPPLFSEAIGLILKRLASKEDFHP
jgi:DNA (cytosine-5)-methyltransferase 1